MFSDRCVCDSHWQELLPSVLTCSLRTQVIGKSAKPIPVLLFGVISGHRKYPVIKYLIVLMIVVGVILFNYKDGGGRSSGGEQYKLLDLIGAGEALVVSQLPSMSLMFSPPTLPPPSKLNTLGY